MNLFTLIFSLIFLVGAGLAVLVGILYGRKYKWQLSLTRIATVIVSAFLAAFIAALVSNVAIGAVARSILSGNVLGEFGAMLAELPNGIAAITALVCMIVAPILFIPLFIVFRLVLNIISKIVLKAVFASLAKKEKEVKAKKEKKEVIRKRINKRNAALAVHHANPIGAALGAVCSVLVLLVFLVPFTGALELAGSVVPIVLDSDEGGAQAVIGDAVEGVSNNAATVTVDILGGKLLYGIMTTNELDGEKANLNKESALAASVANAVISIGDASDPADAAEAVRDISPAFSKSVVTRILITELCSAAGDDWSEGRAYYGIKRPSLGKGFRSLTNAMVDVLATSDKETVKSDVRAITYALAAVIEKDLGDGLSSDPMAVLSNEDATSEIFGALLEDERHMPIVDALADFGVGLMMDSVQAPAIRESLYVDFVFEFRDVRGAEYEELVPAYAAVCDKYGLRVEESKLTLAASAYLAGVNMTRWTVDNIVSSPEDFAAKTDIVSKDIVIDGIATVTDKQHEADALAHAFAVTYNMTRDIKGDSFVAKNMLASMGPALDSFAATETVGKEKTGLMLAAILQSRLVHDQIGFTVLEATDSARSIQANSGANSYASVMTSLSGVIEMLEAASDKTKNTKEAVDRMLENLTPEAADVMQTMATPSVMKNYGVPERSAASSAQMISTTFGNLKNVPSDKYAEESGAVADMMNVMMSITENTDNTRPTFGGEDSATQISEEEYVNNIMDSTAMSKTVVESVYGEGNDPKNDPLNSQKKLSEEEKANLISSLNGRWQTSEKDEATKKEIISIAAMMNLQVDVTDSAVVAVEPVEE